MDLKEEDIKRSWQEYVEELYKKDLNDRDNHDGVVTHLVTDIPESKVKSALEGMNTNKADGTPAELFQVLKDDNAKVLQLDRPAILENSAVAAGREKVSFHSNHKERQGQRTLKLLHNFPHFKQ